MGLKLVLSGGGIPGIIAHAAAVKRLKERGFEIESLAGVSAGAVVAAGTALDLPMHKILRDFLCKKFKLTYNISFSALSKEPYFFDTNIKNVLDFYMDRPMTTVAIPLSIVTNNLNTRQQMVWSSRIHNQRLADVVYASMCIPGAFKPIQINGMIHTDGGVTSNSPADDVYGSASEDVLRLEIHHDPPEAAPPSGFVDFFKTAYIDIPILHNMSEDAGHSDAIYLPVYGSTLANRVSTRYFDHVSKLAVEAVDRWID